MLNKNSFKTNCLTGLILILLYFQIPGICYAQETLTSLEGLWQGSGDYRAVLIRLLEHRNEYPENRCPKLDYMIAVSYCRLNDTPLSNKGCNVWFPRVLYYDLSNDDRRTVEDVRNDICPLGSTNIVINFESTTRKASVAGSLKQYHSSEKPIASIPIERLYDITEDIMHQRIFRKSSPINLNSIISYYNGGNIYESENFLLISHGSHDISQLEAMADKLEIAYNFFTISYGFRDLENYITINIISPSLNNWDRFAERYYGVKLPYGAIGYSQRDDWSMMGLIRHNSIATGTLIHELFHLLVEDNFGDIPVWFEEGLASLYEESKIQNDFSLKGIDGWRGTILRKAFNERPSIENIIRMTPSEFNGTNLVNASSPERPTYEAYNQAINHAFSRYFMIFLQEKDFLLIFYHTLLCFPSNEIEKPPEDQIIMLLENLFGKDIVDIDNEFSEWFYTLN